MQYVAIAIGAFYVFAGVLVVRKVALDHVMDRLLAALSDPSAPNEGARTRALTVGGYLTVAAGCALVLLSALALPLFVANALWQAGYLYWAERALPPEDDDERRGRQQTKNAFVVFLAATAFVAWLALQGLLRPWLPLDLLGRDVLIVAAALLASWASLRLPIKR